MDKKKTVSHNILSKDIAPSFPVDQTGNTLTISTYAGMPDNSYENWAYSFDDILYVEKEWTDFQSGSLQIDLDGTESAIYFRGMNNSILSSLKAESSLQVSTPTETASESPTATETTTETAAETPTATETTTETTTLALTALCSNPESVTLKASNSNVINLARTKYGNIACNQASTWEFGEWDWVSGSSPKNGETDGSFTLSFGFKATAYDVNLITAYNHVQTVNPWYWVYNHPYIRIDNQGKISIRSWDGMDNLSCSNTSIQLNTKHNLTITRSGSSASPSDVIKVYLDGVLTDTITDQILGISNNERKSTRSFVNFGQGHSARGHNMPATNYFDGEFYYLAIWRNGAISATEALNIHNNPSFIKSSTTWPQTGIGLAQSSTFSYDPDFAFFAEDAVQGGGTSWNNCAILKIRAWETYKNVSDYEKGRKVYLNIDNLDINCTTETTTETAL